MLRKKWMKIWVLALVFGLALCLQAYTAGQQDTAAAAQETIEVTAMMASSVLGEVSAESPIACPLPACEYASSASARTS